MRNPYTDADPTAHVFSLSQIRHLMRVEFSRAQRYGYALSALVVCCHGVDRLRDRFGYAFKEAVMDDVVELLQRSTRTCDYLGKLLDDRLVAILPHTGRAGAEATARRILEEARKLAFREGNDVVRITLSIGASHYENENTMFFDSLLEAAERALEEAEGAGGDVAVHADPGPTAFPGSGRRTDPRGGLRYGKP